MVRYVKRIPKSAVNDRFNPFPTAKLIFRPLRAGANFLSNAWAKDRTRKNPGTGCAFSALAPEIARSDKRTRSLTSEQVRNDREFIAGLLPDKDKRVARSKAILTFSALVGAMAPARAVSDESLSREILKTVAGLLKDPASEHRGE